jgi:hypothetical protein
MHDEPGGLVQGTLNMLILKSWLSKRCMDMELVLG